MYPNHAHTERNFERNLFSLSVFLIPPKCYKSKKWKDQKQPLPFFQKIKN